MDYIIQLNYYNYLTYYEYINLLLTCKCYYYNKVFNSDLVYKYYVKNKFTNEFFINSLGDILSFRDFFCRITIFENVLKKYGYEIYDYESFYVYKKQQNLLELKNNLEK